MAAQVGHVYLVEAYTEQHFLIIIPRAAAASWHKLDIGTIAMLPALLVMLSFMGICSINLI